MNTRDVPVNDVCRREPARGNVSLTGAGPRAGSRLHQPQIALTALVVVAGLISAQASLACSCSPPPAPDKAFEQATAVFAGTVQKIALPADRAVKAVTLNAEQAWKGLQHRKPNVTVTTCVNGECCG